jgi:NADPH2:quinone reductase
VLSTVRIEPGEAVLIDAAAGSTGLLLQLARLAGAGIVIGAARGKDKLALISRLGADGDVDYSEDGWVEHVRAATGGQGAAVVLESVGGALGRQAFEATAPGRGRFVVYGFASGTGVTIQTQELTMRGITAIDALGIIGTLPPEEQRKHAERALAEAAAGRLVAEIGQTYPLERAADAHTALEARQTMGKVLLIP